MGCRSGVIVGLASVPPTATGVAIQRPWEGWTLRSPEPEDLPAICTWTALAGHANYRVARAAGVCAAPSPDRARPPPSRESRVIPWDRFPANGSAGRGDAVVIVMARSVVYSFLSLIQTSRSSNALASMSLVAISPAALAVTPFANEVVGYSAGVGVAPGYDDPSRALGSPSRYSDDPTPEWSSVVSPFAPAYLGSQVTSIGVGGSLTLRFDAPVANDAANPFGVDLLVFGNAFYAYNFVTGTTNGSIGGTNAAGVIEVSQDGLAWSVVPGVRPDSAFPTLGYSDLTDPFSPTAGLFEADFTKPVNPTFSAAGLDFAGVLAGYAGSGGGVGVDLASVSLPWISHVRFSLPSDASGTLEIDGVSDVAAIPAPATLVLGALAMLAGGRRRR
jgi:hypothetical protein